MTKTLDLLDKKILVELDQDARQSASKIAKTLKVAKETVNFRIKRLLKNNIIKGFYPILNNSLIDQIPYKIFVKFKQINPKRRKEILDFLSEYQKLSQVLLLEGNFDVQIFILVKSNNELMKFMQSLNSFCGKEIQKKEILIIETMYRFSQKFLNEDKGTTTSVNLIKSDYELKEIELNILRELCKNARMPVLDIAKNINSTSQLVLYHLKKLIKDRVILSTHISINYDKLNIQHYHLSFQVNDHKALNQIIQFFNQKNKSLWATKMIGHYDGSSEILVKNNKELRGFIDELLTKFPEEINILDIFLIYKEYKLKLYSL